MQCPQVTIESTSIRDLVLASALLKGHDIKRVSLIGWDKDPSLNSDSWHELVKSDRKLTAPPAWDPDWRVRWRTRAEDEADQTLEKGGVTPLTPPCAAYSVTNFSSVLLTGN